MTAAAFHAARPKHGAKRVKNAQRVEIDGQKFDSKREASRWSALRTYERTGLISDLRRQVPIDLAGRDGPILTLTGRTMRYVADFVYVDAATGATVIEDAKGHPTETYQMKRAILAAQGIEVREV